VTYPAIFFTVAATFASSDRLGLDVTSNDRRVHHPFGSARALTTNGK